MLNIITGIAFLLLGLPYLGVAINGTLIGIVLVITAILWIVSAIGLVLPEVRH